jgi:hypothetical protein
VVLISPTIGIAGCCAPAASGQAIAALPPSKMTKLAPSSYA